MRHLNEITESHRIMISVRFQKLKICATLLYSLKQLLQAAFNWMHFTGVLQPEFSNRIFSLLYRHKKNITHFMNELGVLNSTILMLKKDFLILYSGMTILGNSK